mmetsp:Transcript_62350/g.91396  ORF Transcript_62350/g.91396 Transcript_62350/m.91396 type:complete len:94 (+) Transcript_62350:373-654(+)
MSMVAEVHDVGMLVVFPFEEKLHTTLDVKVWIIDLGLQILHVLGLESDTCLIIKFSESEVHMCIHFVKYNYHILESCLKIFDLITLETVLFGT